VTPTRREVLWLVLAVVLVDVFFVGAYFVAQVRGASNFSKMFFTALWTLVTLAVVIRGLARVRSVRLRQTP
jgi:uncharacterized membrane protein YhdT